MGGASTEVSGTRRRDVLLEGAYWNPSRIRRTRRALGMSTEASYRFERGIDRWDGAEAMRRCIELVLATAGGELADPPLDLWPEPSHPPRIFLRPARVAQVLGVEVPWEAIERYLVAIGATVVSKPDDGRIAVDVPGWRPDLVREIDLVEEVARIHGYDAFPSDLRPFRLGTLPDAPVEAATAAVRRGHGGAGTVRGVPLPMGPADGGGQRAPRQPPLERRRLAPPAAAARAGAAGGGELGQPRRGRAAVRDRDRLARGRRRRGGPARSGGWPPSSPAGGSRRTGPGAGRRAVRPAGISRAASRRAVALAIPGGVVQVEGSGWVARDAGGRWVGEAVALEADAPPWADPLFGFELLLDPSPRQASPVHAAPDDPRGRTGARAAPPRRGAGRARSRRPSARPAGRCSSGWRSRATIAGRSCRPAPAAWPSGSRSGRRIARCATPRSTPPRPAAGGAGAGSASAGASAGAPAGESDPWHTPTSDPISRRSTSWTSCSVTWPTSWPAGAAAPCAPRRSWPRPGRAAAWWPARSSRTSRQRVVELETENQALRQRIDAAKERLRVLAAPAVVPRAARGRDRRVSTRQERGQGHHRRRGVHRPLRAAAGVHPRSRGLSRRRAQAGAGLDADGRDPQGGHPRRRWPSPTSCSRRAGAIARSPPGSRGWPTIWRGCSRPPSGGAGPQRGEVMGGSLSP